MLKSKQKLEERRRRLLRLLSESSVVDLKLPIVSGEDVIKALHKAGFRVVRQKGSHVRMEKKTEKGTIKVTIPLHPTLKKGTLKQAELSVEEFIKLL